MDPQSLFFVLLVIAIGGYSAYLADILGYKIGKKRLSIKRIRPKYVARISVVIAGMLIPIITMSLLYAVSSVFRTWITRGSEIVRDLEQKSKEVNKINDQLVVGEKKNSQLENTNRILDDELKKKQADAKIQEAKAKTLDGKVTNLTSNIEKIQRDKLRAEAQFAPIRAQLTDLQKRLPEAKKNLDDAKSKLTIAEANLKEADGKYLEASKSYNKISTQNLKLTSQNGELQKKNAEFKQASDNLQGVIDGLNKDIELLKSEKVMAESETRKVNANLKEATDKLAEIQIQVRNAVQDAEKFYRTQTISYLRGEELTRVSVPAKPTIADATNAYRALLRRAKSIATDHGAKPDPDFAFSGAAGMIIKASINRIFTEEEVENYWVNVIKESTSETVLIAKASVNLFGSEPVPLEIISLPNPLVFRKGEIVAESKIDGRLSEIEALNGIREFLRTFVNTKARSRNMIPIQARDGLSYGIFPQEQLLSTVAKVKQVTRVVRLVAIARQDIRAGDSLDIDIEVR